MRAVHASLLIDAAFEFGENSKATQLQRLTLKTLDGLIAATTDLERAQGSGPLTAIMAAEKACEAARRELEHDGGVVVQAEVKAGTPRIAR